MTRTPPTPPKGTPRPRYFIVEARDDSGALLWRNDRPGRTAALETRDAIRKAGWKCEAFAVTSKGLRVRIGGGAK